MPCNSDYLEPTRREQELQKAAELLVYVDQKRGRVPPHWLLKAADNIYCSDDRAVKALCRTIRAMPAEERESVVYNAHCKTSRELATWWEEHLAADQERVARELAE